MKKKIKIKKQKTFKLNLTKFELLHLRDVMSSMLPPHMETVSQCLAKTLDRSIVEAKLWQKMVNACVAAGLPLGDDAPDYVVSVASQPTLGVFEIAQEPNANAVTVESRDEEE